TDPVTVAVSLADKLDTISQFFAINEKPTGSKDPFALRRAALGVISLLERSGLRLRLSDAVSFAVRLFVASQELYAPGRTNELGEWEPLIPWDHIGSFNTEYDLNTDSISILDKLYERWTGKAPLEIVAKYVTLAF